MSNPSPPPVFIPPELTGLNPRGYQDSSGVVRDFLDGAQQLCGRVPDPAYEIDCLADYFEWLSDNLPPTQDFKEARDIIDDAASQLNRVARQNAAPEKRPAFLRESKSASPERTRRPIVPVAPARQAAARAAAVAIVRETETKLLRAAERSERRRVAYTEIAAAVGESSLILLRSR